MSTREFLTFVVVANLLCQFGEVTTATAVILEAWTASLLIVLWIERPWKRREGR